MEPDRGLSETPVGKQRLEGWLAKVMNVLSQISYGKAPHLLGRQRMPKIASACLMQT